MRRITRHLLIGVVAAFAVTPAWAEPAEPGGASAATITIINSTTNQAPAATMGATPAATMAWPVVHTYPTSQAVHMAPGSTLSLTTNAAPALAPVIVEAAPAPPPPPEPTLAISIDLTAQRMTVSENGNARHTWAISSARAGYRTPTGTFKPSWMSKMWYSRQYDMAPMPHAIFFSGGTAIHATYATGMLGRPASHGCVRLAPKNAATLFKMVNAHGKGLTRISVHGRSKQSAPAMASKRRNGATRYAQGQRYQYAPGYYPANAYSSPYAVHKRPSYPARYSGQIQGKKRRDVQRAKPRRGYAYGYGNGSGYAYGGGY